MPRISHFAHALKDMIGDERLADLEAKAFKGKRELAVDRLLMQPGVSGAFVAALADLVGGDPL